MTSLVLSQLTHRYPHNERDTFAPLSLEVGLHETVAMLGASGSGKSTLLKIIAGLIPPTAGEVRWQGQSVNHIAAHQRQFVMVFQDYALFAHLNVFDNIAFALRLKKMPPAQINATVQDWLSRLYIEDLAQKPVWALSGGQQQRVAFARALCASPRLLLLDEPFSQLDAPLRKEMQTLLRALLDDRQLPCILVTHDESEARALAERVVWMR